MAAEHPQPKRQRVHPIAVSGVLIVFTLIAAALLANFVAAQVRTQQIDSLASCPAGSTISYYTDDYPTVSNGAVVALISGNTPLSSFKFSVILQNDTPVVVPDTEGAILTAGAIARVSALLPADQGDVKAVVVLTNCTNVRTEARPLR
jgi:hypothetical protein